MNKQKQLCPKCDGVNFGDSLSGSFICGDCGYEQTTQQIYDQLQRTQWWLDEFKGSLGQCEADSLLKETEVRNTALDEVSIAIHGLTSECKECGNPSINTIIETIISHKEK